MAPHRNKPVGREQDSKEEERPKDELVGGKAEDDGDEGSPKNGNDIDKGSPAAKVPRRGRRTGELTNVAAAVAPVEINRNYVSEIKRDRADRHDY